MKNNYLSILLFSLFIIGIISYSNAQTISTSDYLVARPASDQIVSFDISKEGDSKPIIWGLDTAWPSEENIRRGVAYMGKDNIDIVRVSFQPTRELVNGEFQNGSFVHNGETYQSQKYWLDYRLNLVNLTGENTQVMLNCDHPFVASWFTPSNAATYAQRWEQLIELSAKYVQDKGRTVVSVAPFNEPDYGWGQGSINNFYDIAARLKKNDYFKNIRISGGNTLNCDVALSWYNHLKSQLDEGNTHQLAGEFDGYANFFTTVRANGHHATADELHNVMEAMVGVEYGMQTGIWWGTAELARGEFVKASDGKRLGYAEHRPNWTAAAVYRSPEGKVQAFGGTSERQAATTTFKFLSKDRAVYFDGYGPQREYIMELPGGTGYQQGQTNAERVVNISWGDDIQPAIEGRYILVNRNSGMVMEVAGGSSTAGAAVQQNSNSGKTYQQWKVTPVNSRIGGDFSYFLIHAAHSGKSLDVLNWSLNNGVDIIAWDAAEGANQQWYLEYAEDGWFYIRSRHSACCLEIANSSSTAGARIQQREKNGSANQQWRFLPVDATVEFTAPNSPSNLTATANEVSVLLNWTASPDQDVTGYNIFRSESAGGSYNTIARNVTATSFVDNTVEAGKQYFYTVKAVDYSLNRSAYSNEVSATASGEKTLIANFQFEESLSDNTINFNNGAAYGTISYVNGKSGSKALSLNGSNSFVQLPAEIANHREITIAAWVYWKGTVFSQRIFDFGNGENEYMYLTPRSTDGDYRFVIKNNGEEQQLRTNSMLGRNKWVHVAVTLGSSGASMYIDGQVVSESDAFTISPIDFKPVLNYIGRSQTSNLFSGFIDDFRIYNYALSSEDINKIIGNPSSAIESIVKNDALILFPLPAKDILKINYISENIYNTSTLTIYDIRGKCLMNKDIYQTGNMEINVSNLPNGMYILKLTNKEESLMKKFIIKH